MITSKHVIKHDKYYYVLLTFFTAVLTIIPLILCAIFYHDIVGRSPWITVAFGFYIFLSGVGVILNVYFAWAEWRDHAHCRRRENCCALVRMIDYLKEMWWTYVPPVNAGVIFISGIFFVYQEVRDIILLKRYLRMRCPKRLQ